MASIHAVATRMSITQKVTVPAAKQMSCFLGGAARLRSAAPTAAVRLPTRKPAMPVRALADGYELTAKEATPQGQIEINVRIDGRITQKKFDQVVKELGSNSPAIPGYRRGKGGKNAAVPKQVLINMFGKKRLMAFVVDGLVSDTLLDYVQEEELDAEKESKIKQDTEELMEGWAPGKPISFDAMLQLVGDFEPAPEAIDDAIDVDAKVVETKADVDAEVVETKAEVVETKAE